MPPTRKETSPVFRCDSSQPGGGEGVWADRVLPSLTLSLFFCEMLLSDLTYRVVGKI